MRAVRSEPPLSVRVFKRSRVFHQGNIHEGTPNKLRSTPVICLGVIIKETAIFTNNDKNQHAQNILSLTYNNEIFSVWNVSCVSHTLFTRTTETPGTCCTGIKPYSKVICSKIYYIRTTFKTTKKVVSKTTFRQFQNWSLMRGTVCIENGRKKLDLI